MGETWNNDGSGIADYARTYAQAFRYDGARQRYMDGQLNVDTVEPTTTVWSDYDGDDIYGDFKFNQMGQLNYLRWFEPGIGRVTSPSVIDPEITYYHVDQIGTTRYLSDDGGDLVEPAAYTAFGEQIAGTMENLGDRYGYAGAWGYQTHDDLPFLHVGPRYYDPASGRFVQRDPVGIQGGYNVYSYVRHSPTVFVDPSGLHLKGAIEDATAGGIVGGVAGAASGAVEGAIAGSVAGGFGAGPGAVAGGIAGGMTGSLFGYATGFVCHYVGDFIYHRHPHPLPPLLPPMIGPIGPIGPIFGGF